MNFLLPIAGTKLHTTHFIDFNLPLMYFISLNRTMFTCTAYMYMYMYIHVERPNNNYIIGIGCSCSTPLLLHNYVQEV